MIKPEIDKQEVDNREIPNNQKSSQVENIFNTYKNKAANILKSIMIYIVTIKESQLPGP